MREEPWCLHMTTLELSVALALWSPGRWTAQTLRPVLEQCFELSIPASLLRATLAAMRKAGWLEVRTGHRLVLTPAGLQAAQPAFAALVRQIDGGRGLWKAGLMWSLVGQGGRNETRH